MEKPFASSRPADKMQCTRAALALLALASAGLAEHSVSSEAAGTPALIEALDKLHRGPPVRRSTKRNFVETRWISQKLDNFDDHNERVWDNRVLINENHFVDGAPIFIYLGGEWEIEPSVILSGLWVDIAREHNGSLVHTEHRYFGQSIPIRPLSASNLKYQSVEQALADVVNVIQELKKEDKYKDSKVVVGGCSYSATMAVLLKKLHPHLIMGSWASSAPLEFRLDFYSFMAIVGAAYRTLGGEYCYNLIDNATSYYETLFENGRGAEAKKLLNLCDSFDESDRRDRWILFSTIATAFASIAEQQKPESYDLPKYCSILRSLSPDDATAFSRFLQLFFNGPECIDCHYKNYVKFFKRSMGNYDDFSAGLVWFYQTCTQFGWFHCSGGSRQPFGPISPTSLYTDMCEDVFGPGFSSDRIESHIQETNKKYGGKFATVQNVYMTQGGLDAWSDVGPGADQGATVIPKHSHCSDADSISERDSPELRAAKVRLGELVSEWLA